MASSKRRNKSKKGTGLFDFVEFDVFQRLADRLVRLEEEVTKIKKELQSEKGRNEEFRKKNEDLTKEVNRKDVEISEMSAEVCDLKNKVKEMSIEVDSHQQKLNDKQIDEELIKQANNIIEKTKEFEESVDTVCTVKDGLKSTYAQILEEKDEIKSNKQNDENMNMQANNIIEKTKEFEESVDTVCTVKDEIKSTYAQILEEKDEIMSNKQNDENMNIKQEIKEIIRNNPKLIRETVDMNKSIIIKGKKEEEISNRIIRDKTELSIIMNIMDKVSKEITEKDIQEFHRIGKYESGKHRPIKVTFQSANTMEEVMSNTKNLKDEEEMKNIWIKRYLNKEDREMLKDKIEEAKQKNEARSEEEESLFFFKVVGLQVKKWYINKKDNVMA